MPIIQEEVILNKKRNYVFEEMKTSNFMKKIDNNYGNNTTVILENNRILRSVSKIDKVGEVEIERIIIPESYTIITQRRKPMIPFLYQVSIQILKEEANITILTWINEFELDEVNKDKEVSYLSIIERNDIKNIGRIKEYFENTN
jgi:hypothetical protein